MPFRNLRILLILLISGFFIKPIIAQPNGSFKLLKEKDDVKIYYKWRKLFPYGINADRALILYIDNQKNEEISVGFSIDIYVNTLIHSTSGRLNYCLPPYYEIKGKFKNLAFDTGLDWEEIQSDSVLWEINNLEVQKIEGECTTQSNWLTSRR